MGLLERLQALEQWKTEAQTALPALDERLTSLEASGEDTAEIEARLVPIEEFKEHFDSKVQEYEQRITALENEN